MNRIKNNLREGTRWLLVIYDLVVFTFSVAVFLYFYRGGGVLKNYVDKLEHTVLAFLCIFVIRFLWEVYRQIWRYGGIQCYMRILISDTIACVLYMILDLILPIKTISMSRVISICTINMIGVMAMRMCYRYCFKCGNNTEPWGRFLNKVLRIFAGKEIAKQKNAQKRQIKIAIIGAGRIGVSLAEELMTNYEANCVPVCFVDIDESKAGRQIRDIPVLSPDAATFDILSEYGVEEIVFAIPSMESKRKKKLFNHYMQMGYPVKVYDFPTMQTAGAKRQLRSFEVEEVLFRTPLQVTDQKTYDYYKDKVILVTGVGSIGSEMARQVAKMGPKQIILLDVYENGAYDVQQELRMNYAGQIDIQVEIVSITNKKGMERVFREYRPQIVINAAAHKHVPLMEKNCIEAVENNVFGTLNVVELCEQYQVERFMMLSTDKAVNPTNVMGATKRMCEMIMQAYSTFGQVRYSATRFGNVLGSAGSVIPLFKRQIAHGGPITITDKRIIRYFMTIPEASQLVLKSGSMAKNGEIFVLDMGEPVKIWDLAENMIQLSGLRPHKDIEIKEIGLRPGEKLYEELLVKTEELDKTDDDMIYIERDLPITKQMLDEKLTLLRNACRTGDNNFVREVLRQVVPTFRRPEEVNGKVKQEKVS